MGSPLSPILADLVIQVLENHILSNINIDIPVYYRYVDDILLVVPDILLAVPDNQIHVYIILDKFNSYQLTEIHIWT